MSEQSMVDRVAAALNFELAGIERDVRVSQLTDSELAEMARVAIEAMREPTPDMRKAAGFYVSMDSAWQAMIDAALK